MSHTLRHEPQSLVGLHVKICDSCSWVRGTVLAATPHNVYDGLVLLFAKDDAPPGKVENFFLRPTAIVYAWTPPFVGLTVDARTAEIILGLAVQGLAASREALDRFAVEVKALRLVGVADEDRPRPIPKA